MCLQSLLTFHPSSRGNSISFFRIGGADDWDWIPSTASSLIMHHPGNHRSATVPNHVSGLSLPQVQSQTLSFCTFGWLLPKLLVHGVRWITFTLHGLASLIHVFYQRKNEALDPNTCMNPIHSTCIWNGVTKKSQNQRKKLSLDSC